MDIAIEKLELMRLVLDTNSEDALKKVRVILKKYSAGSETEHLLSTKANREHLKRSINQMNEGNHKVIKTADLWK
jgi:PHD/YefM family antitoxin component YafN of YafNO toxin-antitoxin module